MLKKLKTHEYPLLQRKSITYEIEHLKQATPSKKVLQEQVAKNLNVEPNLVSIRNVYTNFGMQKSQIIANIYEDEKNLKFLETPKGKTVKKEAAQPAKA